MSLLTTAVDVVKPRDVRRDPREELRKMVLQEPVRGFVLQRLPPGATLVDDSAPDPYDDSPDAVGRTFTVLRVPPREIVLLQIPEWIADDGRSVGALDESRYAFRGKIVRITAPMPRPPSLGLETLMDAWKTHERIDAAFVSWRYLEEMGQGRHSLSRVLRVADLPESSAGAAPAPPTGSAGPKVFISYAHDDRPWQQMLMKQLSPLSDKYGEAIWSDNELKAGDDWMAKIIDALNQSSIVVLLVSPSFIASKFIKAHEFSVALKEAKANNKKLIWVYVTTCPYMDVGIGAFQAAHDIDKALDQRPLGDQWAQLQKVYESLAQALAEWKR